MFNLLAAGFVTLWLFLPAKSFAARVVDVQVTKAGFEPAVLTAEPGETLTLRVTRITDSTCATQIQVPSRKLKADLPLNKPVLISLGKLEKGEIRFACGMDMLSAKVVTKIGQQFGLQTIFSEEFQIRLLSNILPPSITFDSETAGMCMEIELDDETFCADCSKDQFFATTSGKQFKNAAVAPPDHSASKKRINRVKGQLDAVSRMIDERQYCPNIIQQIRAATSALKGLEAEVLRGHLRGCVRSAFESKNAFDVNDKIEEVLELLKR